jgi:hypothetical protein
MKEDIGFINASWMIRSLPAHPDQLIQRISLTSTQFQFTTITLQFSRTHTFNPSPITPNRSEILIPVLSDDDHILKPHPAHTFVFLQNVDVDVL